MPQTGKAVKQANKHTHRRHQGTRRFPWAFPSVAELRAGAKFLGGAETVSFIKRKPDSKQGKKKPCRRILNAKDQEAKRRRREAAAGMQNRAEYGDADVELRQRARKPPEGADETAWVKGEIVRALAFTDGPSVAVMKHGELWQAYAKGEANLEPCGQGPAVEFMVRTFLSTYPVEYTTSHILKLWKKGDFLFVRGASPLDKIRPWGADEDTDPAEYALSGSRERVSMALCFECGQWRTVPTRTAKAFAGEKKQFKCKKSPWIAEDEGCKASLNDEEAQYPKVHPSKRMRLNEDE